MEILALENDLVFDIFDGELTFFDSMENVP